MFRCVICGDTVVGFGNNPQPISDVGECCDACNLTKVIPARLKEATQGKPENTLKSLYKVMDDALYTYGNCLCDDIEQAGMTEKLERWRELTAEILNEIEEKIM